MGDLYRPDYMSKLRRLPFTIPFLVCVTTTTLMVWAFYFQVLSMAYFEIKSFLILLLLLFGTGSQSLFAYSIIQNRFHLFLLYLCLCVVWFLLNLVIGCVFPTIFMQTFGSFRSIMLWVCTMVWFATLTIFGRPLIRIIKNVGESNAIVPEDIEDVAVTGEQGNEQDGGAAIVGEEHAGNRLRIKLLSNTIYWL